MAKDVITRFKADVGNYDANIAKARRQLEGFKQDNLSAGGVMKQLSGSLVSAAAKFASIGAAASAAMKVVKDAFFQSESNIDEWGRTVEGSKAAYSTFLNTLNSGNWGNFFTNLSTAVKGARDLYDSIDRLNSIKANNAAAIAIVQQQIAQLRLMKQQGKDVDDQLKLATENLRQLQDQSVNAGMEAGHKTILETIRGRVNTLNTEGIAIPEVMLRHYAAQLEYNGQQVFDDMKNQAASLKAKGTVMKTTEMVDDYGRTIQFTGPGFDWSQLTAEEQRIYVIAQAITEGETEIQKGIALFAQAVKEGTSAAREEFKDNRYSLTGGNKGGGGGKDTPLQNSMDGLNDTIKQLNDAIKGTDDPLLRTILEVQLQKATRQLELTTPPALATSVANSFAAPGLDTSKLMEQAGVDMMRYWTSPYYNNMPEDEKKGANFMSQYNQAVGGLSQIAGGFKQMGIDLPEEVDKVLGVLQGISSIIAGVTAVLEVFGITGMTANTTALIANTAALAANTAAVGTNSILGFIPFFGGGGIAHAAAGLRVPGNFMANDMVPAMVNSGELILNQAEQGILAANLQQSSWANNLQLTAVVSGAQLRMVLSNDSKMRMQGQYVTSKFAQS